MHIHKRLIILVGLGMLLTMAITVLSVENIAGVFSGTVHSVSTISLEVRKIWNIEQKLGDSARMMREYVRTGDDHYRRNYQILHDAAGRMLSEMNSLDLDKRELKALGALMNDLNTINGTAGRILALDLSVPESRAEAVTLLNDLESLGAWMQHDIERYKEENAVRLDAVGRDIQRTKLRITILFGIILITMVGFLLAFGVYLYRKLSVPLFQLWQGTEEISFGNLDHRIQVRGEADIAQLAERFNEMAAKLQASYADLEQRLLERTEQLTALNSVALMLGRTGILGSVLQESLRTVLKSLADMEPRGGIFLCEPDGENLQLTAHIGLSPEFAAREARIRMGECLCGRVAQTGEMLYSEKGCRDPLHTREASGEEGHAHIVVPIKSRGITLGVMFLYPAKAFTLNPSDIQMFDTIGAQLGMAVENLRLYAEVRDSSEKYWDLFEHSRDILFTVDREGRLTVVNGTTERFLGRAKRDLIGASLFGFLAEESRTLAKRIMTGAVPLGERTFEFEVVTQGGGRAYLEVSGRRLVQPGASGYQFAARDVTEQKDLRALLVKAERLAAIGQVGIAVRHEINNPLTTVIGNTELLLDRLGGGEDEMKKRLELILSNALRIAEIVKRMQEIKQERTVDYLKGVKMTDLTKE